MRIKIVSSDNGVVIMRRLLCILSLFVSVLAVFAAPVYAQSDPTNPTPDPTCGLPKEGAIVATVIYTLKANCTQTGALEIKTANIPSGEEVELTINGNNKTISVGKDKRMNFLIVDDQGLDTYFDADVTASPNVKVIINDVTFDGNGRSFTSHYYQGGGEYCTGKPCRTFHGSGISAEGTLEMENVTFTGGNGSWLRAEGTATLENVLFEDNWISSLGFSEKSRGVLHVTGTGSVTLNKAVFRDTARTVIAIEKGGSLSTTGCLSFIRVLTHKAHHSGVYSGLGTWSDSSTGACTGAIGNQGQAVVAYTPPTMPCGLPSGGTIEGIVVYTLTQPCVCVNTVNIAVGASVTINANGNRIDGCTSGDGFGRFNIGNAHLTVNNAILYNIRVYTYGGQFTLADSSVQNAVKVPIVNYGWAYLLNSLFENNRGSSTANVYYGHAYYGLGRTLFRDNVFHNNGPGDIEAYTAGRGSAIYLCGENILDGDIPTGLAQYLMAADGGRIFGCPGPSPRSKGEPANAPARAECPPGPVAQPKKQSLGAIGVILYVEKCPLAIEVWEVLPNSQGQFALAVSQADIEAMKEGDTICSVNGRAAVRNGLTEPVRQIMAYSKTYVPPSRRGGRDILVSLGPNYEDKVHHVVIDHALDGSVMGVVDTRPAGPPCEGAASTSRQPGARATTSAPAPPPQPTPIPIAAPVTAQSAQADGSIVHVVRSGDTIWQIGVAYGVHPYKIMSLNDLDQLSSQGSYLYPGQELLIRPAS